MQVQPYLFFEGRCEEALELYRSAAAARVEFLMRFKDSPEQGQCGGSPEKVMHCSFQIGESTIMASDGECGGNASFQGFALSIAVKSADEADKIFNGLAADGKVIMPLAQTFWSPRFGMVTDRFGVMWMLNVVE